MTVKDGTLILREIGFTNKAAEMQLTALYQSPRKNNLFLAMDFHLLRVQINDLLTMIPYIDTLVPMLKTFDTPKACGLLSYYFLFPVFLFSCVFVGIRHSKIRMIKATSH